MTNATLTQTIAAANAAGLSPEQIASLVTALTPASAEPVAHETDDHDDGTLATTYEVLPEDADEPTPSPRPKAGRKTKAPKAKRARDARLPASGSSLERAYKGDVYVVLFTNSNAVSCGGDRYTSLSSLGKAITGSETNGFRFFGLLAGGSPSPRKAKAPKAGRKATPKASPKREARVSVPVGAATAATMIVREWRLGREKAAQTGSAKNARKLLAEATMAEFIEQALSA